MAESSETAPAKKSTKSASRRGSADAEGSDGGAQRTTRAPRTQSRPKPRSVEVAARAAREFRELTGKDQEGIVGLQRTEDGWTVQVEVVEVRRIPDTTDMLGVYDIDTDAHGSLEGYRRVRRYVRGSGEEGS